MKYLVKFNEATNIFSSDRINEINKELELQSNQVDKFIQSYEKISKELEPFLSKDKDKNTQIDDSAVDLKSLIENMQECKKLMININASLEDYAKSGEKYLG